MHFSCIHHSCFARLFSVVGYCDGFRPNQLLVLCSQDEFGAQSIGKILQICNNTDSCCRSVSGRCMVLLDTDTEWCIERVYNAEMVNNGNRKRYTTRKVVVALAVCLIIDIIVQTIFWTRIFPIIGLPASSQEMKYYGQGSFNVYRLLLLTGCGLAVWIEKVLRKQPKETQLYKRDALVLVILVFNIMQPLLMFLCRVLGNLSVP